MTKTEQQAAIKDTIQELLATSDRAVERGLLRIYERQTADEQASDTTHHHNARGFTGLDADFLSRAAKGCLRYGHLTDRQMPYVRSKMMKYWAQLAEVAAANGKPILAADDAAAEVRKAEDARVAQVTTHEDDVADERRWDAEIQQAEAAEEQRRMDYKFGITSPQAPLGNSY
jgi:CRISPR/Cas system-associated endonuclease Cas3-HD